MTSTRSDYTFNYLTVAVLIPLAETVRANYAGELARGKNAAFPFWSKVWSSASALCQFIANHSHFIRNKNVLEIAGGLGLPSLLAAQMADHVCYSDYLPEPVEMVAQSGLLNGLTTLTCCQLNWQNIPEDLLPDVLLLSDINYNPDDFDLLMQVIKRFIDNGTTILLSTPQRLMGKSFIEQLLPWCIMTEELEVKEGDQSTMISVLVLRGR